MMKRILQILVMAVTLLAIVITPAQSLQEDEPAQALAQTLYAMARSESYDAMLAVGSVVMNRVTSSEFPDTLMEVLDQQQQFARGTKYDERSLQAAQYLLNGTRTLPGDVLYLKQDNGAMSWNGTGFYMQIGGYQFYTLKQSL